MGTVAATALAHWIYDIIYILISRNPAQIESLSVLLLMFLRKAHMRATLPGTRHQVPGTWYQAPGASYLVPSTWYRVPGTRALVYFSPGSDPNESSDSILYDENA